MPAASRLAALAAPLALLLFIVGLALGLAAGKALLSGGGEGEVPAACANMGLLDEIKERGVLLVGTSADWPPYEYITPDGQYAGIDIRLAEEIGKALGVKVEIVDMDFAALFQAVQDGRVDIVIADVAMKPQRLEAVDFTIPYRCESGKAIIVRAGDADSYTGKEWLAGKKIGVQTATVEEELAKNTFTDSEIVAFDRVYPEMTLALKTGKIDAIVVAPDVAKVIVALEDGLAIVDEIPYQGCSAVVVPHCALSLKQAVSQVIWDLQQSGQLDQIIQEEMAKWLQAQAEG